MLLFFISLKVNKLEYAFPYITGRYIYFLCIVCAYKQEKIYKKKKERVISGAFVAVNALKEDIFLVDQQLPYFLTYFLDIVYYNTMLRKYFL